MNVIRLLFSPKGRIGRGPFWLGVGVLVVATIAFNTIRGYGSLVIAPLIWCWICLYAKRLHDLGLSGWVQFPAQLIALVILLRAYISVRLLLEARNPLGDPGAGWLDDDSILMDGRFGYVLLIGGLISLGYILWLGIAKGQAAENRYGPPVAAGRTV